LFDLGLILFWWFVIEDLDLPALGHLEVAGGFQFAHRVALAQVKVDFDLHVMRLR
jgi:hypothetical protein